MNVNQRRMSMARLMSIGLMLLLAGGSARAQDPAAAGPNDVVAAHAAFDRQDWHAAVDGYRRAIAAGNASVLVQMRLGYALHVLGRLDEALPHHRRAAAATHREIRIDGLYNLACAYALKRETELALDHLAKAIDAGFTDKAQLAKDTDLDSLRDNERFQRLVEGIGAAPRLAQQMDFLIGAWAHFDDQGRETQTLTFTRPLEGSHGLASTSTNIGGGQFTGLAHPVSADRTWRWVYVDGMGTTVELTGRSLAGGGMRFEGGDQSPVGPSFWLRLTFTPQTDGSVVEKVESSLDGSAWHLHHEERLTRRTFPASQPS